MTHWAISSWRTPALVLLALIGVLGTVRIAEADPLGLVDYEAIMEENAEDIVEDNGVETLVLENGIILRRSEGGTMGIDLATEEGALGCLTGILLDVLVAGQTCEGLVTDEQISSLKLTLDAAVLLYAQGMRPEPLPEDTVRARMEEVIVQKSERMICEEIAEPEMFGLFADGLSPENLGPPRLPVWNPCL